MTRFRSGCWKSSKALLQTITSLWKNGIVMGTTYTFSSKETQMRNSPSLSMHINRPAAAWLKRSFLKSGNPCHIQNVQLEEKMRKILIAAVIIYMISNIPLLFIALMIKEYIIFLVYLFIETILVFCLYYIKTHR